MDNHNYRTRHSIHLIGRSFASSLNTQFYVFLLFIPQRVLLNEHFFENHNYRTRQNIRQRRKRATDQAHTMTSTVVIIKQQEFLLIKPLEEVKKNKKLHL